MDRKDSSPKNRRIADTGIISTEIVCLLGLVLSLLQAAAATYYVSPDGDDGAAGRSPKTPWRSLSKVSATVFQPRDVVLFKRGGTFEGTLRFDQPDSGTEGSPVRVGTYGSEQAKRPVLRPGRGRGIDLHNVSWIRIRDLIVEGDGPEVNGEDGILLLSSTDSGAENVVVENVEVSGFGDSGISIGVWQTASGFRGVRIARCSLHDNRKAGVHAWGKWGPGIYSHRNVHIVDSIAFHMKGGSGLILSSVNGGVIERCIAHSNGEQVSGAAGIWAWDSNDILFQYNESYGNRTTGVDGDGFDFDGGVTNSVMQYNYSHDNDAAGFLLAQYAYAPQPMNNIVIRHNVSRNDCRKKDYGAIHVWKARDEEEIRNIRISHNTVFLSGDRLEQPFGSEPCAEPEVGWERGGSGIAIVSPTTSVSVEKNVFQTTGGRYLVSVVPGQNEISFRENLYWTGDDPFLIRWMNASHASLAEWLTAARDQERTGSGIAAICSDPALAAAGVGAAGEWPKGLRERLRFDGPSTEHDLAEARPSALRETSPDQKEGGGGTVLPTDAESF